MLGMKNDTTDSTDSCKPLNEFITELKTYKPATIQDMFFDLGLGPAYFDLSGDMLVEHNSVKEDVVTEKREEVLRHISAEEFQY